MLRKLAMPVLGAFALAAPGLYQPAQAAQFSHALDKGLTPLVEPVGGHWHGNGGSGNGGHWSGNGSSGNSGHWSGNGSSGNAGHWSGNGNSGNSGHWSGNGNSGHDGPGKGGYGGYSNGSHHHHHRHHFYRSGLGFYLSDDYDNDNDCVELRERAIDTASAYWWRRYRYCLDNLD